MTMNITPKEVEAIRRWAESMPEVKRCWIFGSRYKGEAKPASDIDIAVERLIGPDDEPNGTLFWIDAGDGWKEALQGLLPYVIDLQLYEGPSETPSLHEYLKVSQIIFER